MKCSLPEVLFVLGRRSWLRWLPDFLADPQYNYSLEFSDRIDPDNLDQFIFNVVKEPRDAVVFLSDHSTIVRDAEVEQRISYYGVTSTVCQPLSVAEMSRDKRLMMHHAKRVAGLHTIPELTYEEALSYLDADPSHAVVGKLASGTEGEGMTLFHTAESLRKRYHSLTPSYAYVLQPFIHGEEYSLTILCDRRRYQVYEPVSKGMTSRQGVHPCRRERVVPGRFRDRTIRSRMIELGVSYVRNLRPRGLVEIEFIVSDGEVYFLEINPSVTTTMRMVAGISLRNPFAEIAKMGLGMKLENGLVPIWGNAIEFPLPHELPESLNRELCEQGDVSVSSRVTVYARSVDGLTRRVDEVRSLVQDESRRTHS
jgi:carbamoylphosphate synthase large subunit